MHDVVAMICHSAVQLKSLQPLHSRVSWSTARTIFYTLSTSISACRSAGHAISGAGGRPSGWSWLPEVLSKLRVRCCRCLLRETIARVAPSDSGRPGHTCRVTVVDAAGLAPSNAAAAAAAADDDGWHAMSTTRMPNELFQRRWIDDAARHLRVRLSYVTVARCVAAIITDKIITLCIINRLLPDKHLYQTTPINVLFTLSISK